MENYSTTIGCVRDVLGDSSTKAHYVCWRLDFSGPTLLASSWQWTVEVDSGHPCDFSSTKTEQVGARSICQLSGSPSSPDEVCEDTWRMYAAQAKCCIQRMDMIYSFLSCDQGQKGSRPDKLSASTSAWWSKAKSSSQVTQICKPLTTKDLNILAMRPDHPSRPDGHIYPDRD